MLQYLVTGRLPNAVSEARLRRVAVGCAGAFSARKRNGVIGLRFVSPLEIQRLNRAFRGKNRVTDVLSFSATEGEAFPRPPAGRGVSREPVEIGDLVVCSSYASAEARRRAIAPAEELVRLIVHGTLHLAGLDHVTAREEERMFRKQEEIVEEVMGYEL